MDTAERDSVYERLDRILDAFVYDIGVRIEIASECCWSCELRLTLEPNNRNGPDRSHVVFAGGGVSPEDVLARCIDGLNEWLVEMGKPSLAVDDASIQGR